MTKWCEHTAKASRPRPWHTAIVSADAQRAYERGDYAKAARLTRAGEPGDQAAQAASEILLGRLKTDPWVWALGLFGSLLLILCASAMSG